tara:strand:- start:1186 stop:2106 length:921 start_codon:yes stop_codon:yes gene_type:complete
MGPTASGKTQMACDMVAKYPFEIVSVDSAMIYKDMTIGTAKPDKATLAKAPHHLIDFLEPTHTYSAARFCADAESLIEDIHLKGKYPLLVGGTMMYFNALQNGLSVLPKADETIRQNILDEAKLLGWHTIHERLKQIDPVSALEIKPTDTQRLQRAMEVYLLTNTPPSKLKKRTPPKYSDRFLNIRLMPGDRTWLHQRIQSRFEQMLEQGFILEVKNLLDKWSLASGDPAMRIVGYRQAFEFLVGRDSYTTFKNKAIASTRQLAKRQLTWLRNNWSNDIFIEPDKSDAFEKIESIITTRLDLKAES